MPEVSHGERQHSWQGSDEPGGNLPHSALRLENQSLSITLVPELGGKFTSLISKPGLVEWLHPPLRTYREAKSGGSFSESDGGGFDECLPSIASSLGIPDHGDLWRVSWTGGRRGDVVELTADSTSRPLRLWRSAQLDGATLALLYAVRNTGQDTSGFLWSAHPLLNVDPGDRIVLPSEITEVRVENSTGPELAEPGNRCAWPFARTTTGQIMDLSEMRERDGITSAKLFAGPLQHGWCGVYRTQLRQGIGFRFQPQQLPYVGVWISCGAWPQGAASRQYTVALEPTTSCGDALDTALANGTAVSIAPGQRLSWTLELSIFGHAEPISFPQFRELLEGQE